MELPDLIDHDDMTVTVPGELPPLWAHQQAALKRMYAFEQMVKQSHEHMPTTTPRAILALAPGSGKSRVVLALCQSMPRVKTIIVVLPSMVAHWLNELRAVGVHEGDPYIRVISNLQSHHVLDSTINGCRIVYDETEALRNAAAKPATKFTHEHDMSDPKNRHAFDAKPLILWLLDGSYDHLNHVSAHAVQSWSSEGPAEPRIVYVPNRKGTKVQSFGIDYFPANVVRCAPDYIVGSQQLNLMAPTIEIVKMNDQLAHLAFLNDGITATCQLQNLDTTCLGIMNVSVFCDNMRAELVREMNECSDIIMRFDDELLLSDTMGNLNLNANDDEPLLVVPPTPTPVSMRNPAIANLVNDAKARKEKARSHLALLDKLRDNASRCSICLSEKIVHPPAISPCCYTRFCYYCIHPWVNAYNNCPHCRKSLYVTDLLLDLEARPESNIVVPMHPFAVLEKYAIEPAQQEQQLILVYFDDCRQNKASIEEHIDFCVRTYGSDLCYSSLKHPNIIRQFENDSMRGESERRGRVLFLTDRVGLKGVNLCAADAIIIMSPISEVKLAQLIGRAQRPGRRSDHQLRVYRTRIEH